MSKYQFSGFYGFFFQHLSHDISILESQHQHFGVATLAFVSHDISTCESLHQHSGLVAGSVAIVFLLCRDIFLLCRDISNFESLHQHFES